MDNLKSYSERGREVSWQDSPYWSDKGNPKEQFDVAFEGRRLEVANFSDVSLTKDQLEELQRIIAEFSQIKDGEVFDKVKSICVDNLQPIDPETKEGVNGMGAEKDDGIVKLYPRALKPISHRVEGVSNFAGTVIHELAHAVETSETQVEWRERFEWLLNSDKIGELRKLGLMEKLKSTPQKDWVNLHPDIWNLVRFWTIMQPERCVTDYAKLSPEDDFAESMVAALRNPDLLDSQRSRFLKNNFLSNVKEATAFKVDIQRRLVD